VGVGAAISDHPGIFLKEILRTNPLLFPLRVDLSPNLPTWLQRQKTITLPRTRIGKTRRVPERFLKNDLVRRNLTRGLKPASTMVGLPEEAGVM
jgi:hypothetical protein